MSLKQKLLGLALLASLATTVFVAVTASASKRDGHFTTPGVNNAEIFGTENTLHTVEFNIENWGKGVICNSTKWEIETTKEEETELPFFANFAGCRTTGGTAGEVKINRNGCALILFAVKGTTDATEQTADISCTSGSIEIIHGACTVTVPAQTKLTGITYTKTTFFGAKAFTVDFNAKIAVKLDGFCGTAKPAGTLTGSLTLHAAEKGGSTTEFEIT
jgi:hypothetical protein